MMVKCVALEVAYFDIRVNGIAPGITNSKTRMKQESLAFTNDENNQYLHQQESYVPLNH